MVSETIPYHRDYQVVLPKERILYRKVSYTPHFKLQFKLQFLACSICVNMFSFGHNLSLQKLISVLDELEHLKPEFDRRVSELNKAHAGTQLPQLDDPERSLYSSENSSLQWPAVNKRSPTISSKQVSKQVSWPNKVPLLHY